jgi:regulator of extracellular matrix RemA (YlzA/DUF370 family)
MKHKLTRTSHKRRTPRHPAGNRVATGPICVPSPAAADSSTFIESAERQGMIAEAAYARPKSALSIAHNDIEHLSPAPATPVLAGD